MNITIITFLAFLKLLNKKKTQEQNKYAVWVNKHSQIIFFYLRDCDTSLSDCMHTSCMTLTNILGIKTGIKEK